MQQVLWTIGAILAYIVGLVVIWIITPKMQRYSIDDPAFMGWAVLDVLGAFLAFACIVVLLLVFDGAMAVRVIDFFLILGIIAVAVRMALSSLRAKYVSGTHRVSRIAAGIYGIFLAVIGIFALVQLFVLG
ncbi:hypothetical protein EI42_04479 [Thermosporothrix hazakensis]|jgi:Co/Zn/Cd efflux system component|uniref:Uncharacterized protein n=2 Tax=Thermosporothrix TaxID=768650 RepID=A0A326U1N0_THEHA|nr:hypothetical protein [Thermosporothrix hazakensis]PZW24871.1 hypothetical protein EI42_04479 [Thermosporothrix hazakensis]BBH88254.1 hypothetical protein KTC_30050 [Thermosporothrix sp. COM3]GCE46441.1 hypothetical protein KTH_13100 [Thermosporothrix hazakensis]